MFNSAPRSLTRLWKRQSMQSSMVIILLTFVTQGTPEEPPLPMLDTAQAQMRLGMSVPPVRADWECNKTHPLDNAFPYVSVVTAHSNGLHDITDRLIVKLADKFIHRAFNVFRFSCLSSLVKFVEAGGAWRALLHSSWPICHSSRSLGGLSSSMFEAGNRGLVSIFGGYMYAPQQRMFSVWDLNSTDLDSTMLKRKFERTKRQMEGTKHYPKPIKERDRKIESKWSKKSDSERGPCGKMQDVRKPRRANRRKKQLKRSKRSKKAKWEGASDSKSMRR
eukprot:gnl/MRDRNA2_/MRDRNA2_76011_c0_seq3.p1 gnl/MRDRNA2_/MRDRNA2_76011_c0~~gnl/MRDRNA2_/MRDRNA2_76011_c0_seq3.p1  ORF type:complete len:277 (+),score=16.35 gnl/MRDRNA2_/MRDRNA2_76011_c0_seq3:106-936(+)